VSTITPVARSVPRKDPATFDCPPVRRRLGTGISLIRNPPPGHARPGCGRPARNHAADSTGPALDPTGRRDRRHRHRGNRGHRIGGVCTRLTGTSIASAGIDHPWRRRDEPCLASRPCCHRRQRSLPAQFRGGFSWTTAAIATASLTVVMITVTSTVMGRRRRRSVLQSGGQRRYKLNHNPQFWHGVGGEALRGEPRNRTVPDIPQCLVVASPNVRFSYPRAETGAMQHGSARPCAVKYISYHGRRQVALGFSSAER
jgi:hypothetical protein